jgi:hypothetical protein
MHPRLETFLPHRGSEEPIAIQRFAVLGDDETFQFLFARHRNGTNALISFKSA